MAAIDTSAPRRALTQLILLTPGAAPKWQFFISGRNSRRHAANARRENFAARYMPLGGRLPKQVRGRAAGMGLSIRDCPTFIRSPERILGCEKPRAKLAADGRNIEANERRYV